ncbi:MAG: IS5 family transposase [Hymenobacter sp.]|nr:MAG: IS5 family transposase [Hymenobacter sp.]
MAGPQRLPVAGAARRLGQLAHDLHAFPALGRVRRVGPGAGGRAAGRRPAHAAGGFDHRAGAPARERGAQKNGPQALGRSRSGLTSKLHVAADARGRPVRFSLTADQRPDAPQALPLLEGLAPAYVVADRGYDSDPLVAVLAARGICAVIPLRRKRRIPRAYDAARYAQRHPIERLFSRLKQFRRVATRYDKLDTHFLAFVHLAATVLWLRDC